MDYKDWLIEEFARLSDDEQEAMEAEAEADRLYFENEFPFDFGA